MSQEDYLLATRRQQAVIGSGERPAEAIEFEERHHHRRVELLLSAREAIEPNNARANKVALAPTIQSSQSLRLIRDLSAARAGHDAY
jgi:hypothetical protein